MSDIVFDDFNYNIEVCPNCGLQKEFGEICECEAPQIETNLNMLFQDQLINFAHLVTTESQTKQEFLENVESAYSLSNPKTNLFYISCKKSDFVNIRLNDSRDAILFNQ